MTTTDESLAATTSTPDEPTSIINEMLDIDDLLATDVRRAEKTVIIYTKPHLEAEIDALDVELKVITDGGRGQLVDDEAAVGDAPAGAERTAEVVATEIQSKRREYAGSGKKIRLRQLLSEDWMAFEQKWKEALGQGAPYPVAMWNDLISQSAVSPKMSVDNVHQLRAKLGNPPMTKLAMTCWNLNTEAGLSVPFSRLSSRVLLLNQPETS